MNRNQDEAAKYEAQLLGCMLTKTECIMKAVSAGVKADDFSVPMHKQIYQTIVTLQNDGEKLIDPMKVINRMKADKPSENIQEVYVIELLSAPGTLAAADQYANMVRRLSVKRNIQDLKKKLNEEADTNKEIQIVRALEAMEEELQILTDQTDSRPNGVYDYLSKCFADDVSAFAKGSSRRTGFEDFDKKSGGLYAGLYVVGGSSSLGKTTLVHQIADQLAERGNHVLYFSLEMSKLELVSKSIARIVAKTGMQGVTSLSIRKGRYSEYVNAAAVKYAQAVGNNLNIIEGNFDCTVSKISNITRNHISKTGETPVVIIDYLQIMQADADPSTNRKPTETRQITDQNVTALKRLSRSLDVPVIVVSSLNRGSYLQPISFESFKESGGIEYTADVVIGLNLQAVHTVTDEKNDTKKRETLQKAKEASPRKIELVCIKNRYGRDFKVNFDYYSDRDTFRES